MYTGYKKKHVKFTFKSIIRLIIFSVIIFFIISYISGQKLNSSLSIDPTISINEKQSNFILGKTTEIGNNIYNSIPEGSRQQLENLNQTPAVNFIQEKINLIKEASQGFPQKQIKEIQKMLLKNVYENSLRNIDSQ
ncbi:MAG: hypothetical protein PHE32_02685 [Candidatus Shapirobacteria bacterium]|nr:hypothetical protein [Candidatus Shapirobacteria bacterium]MDD4410579.1 hypothetical protein [Candidatus Shapirobacteria bacterium]